ncbi:MAG TPA: NAD(P)/FAD-dependent oxidoreductase [Polyangiaceae bacterium]|nr:NAD(P)/FAD-dependent oxidoreductase [Polyangiaceae bacterium]
MSGDGERRFDVIVIGSGIGGLTAALSALSRGASVLVIEAAKELGGYTNPFRRGPYSFDPGLHYIGECGPGQAFTRILEELGVQIRFRELSPDGFDRLVFPGYEIAMPRGAERYKERLASDFPGEREGLDRFFELIAVVRRVVAAVRDPSSLGAPATQIQKQIPLVPGSRLLFKYVRATLGELLREHFRDPLLRAVLAAQCGNYGLPPGRASAIAGLGVLDHYLEGAYFPIGGSGALRDAFVTAIQGRGGVFIRNCPVDRILIKNGRAGGVTCRNGESYLARAVISNADAVATYRDLLAPESLPAWIAQKIERTRPSLSSLCLFIGTPLDIEAAGMTDANIWHFSSSDIDGGYEPLFRGELPPDDVCFYFLSAPSLKDPESALGNTETSPPRHRLELVALLPYQIFAPWDGQKPMKRGPAYAALKERLANRYLASIERYVPSIGQHIDVIEVGTPVTNAAYAAAIEGALYGPEHTPELYGARRFSTEAALPGLFLCGASVLGGGIVPSALSGFAAGKLASASMSARSLAGRG